MSPVSVTQAATALSNTGSVMECLPCEDSAARLSARVSALATIAKARGPRSAATRRGQAFRSGPTAEQTPVMHWEGVLGVEGEMTGDGRLIQPGALRWDDLPIPLRHVGADVGAHQGAEVSGRILAIERRPGGIIWGSGDFDLESELGREAARKVEKKLMNGVSMDLDDVAFEVRVAAEAAALVVDGMQPLALDAEAADDDGRVSVKEVSPDDEVMVTTGARVRASTQVAVPAFSRAKIELTDAGRAALAEAQKALVASAARRRRQVFDKGGHLPKAARTTLSVEPLPAAPPEAVCAHDGCDLSPVFAVSSSEPGIDVLYCSTHAGEHEDGPLPAATLDLLTEPALAAEMILNAVTPPPFVATIAAALVTRGRESEKALATALATVSRWAAGGSVAVHGGPAVDLGTQAKAAEALAQLEGADANGTFNWVDDVGGLPRKIRDIADAIMKKGTPEGHAIAIAVNAVKKGCATGDLNFPGKQDMNPVSRADYCAAVAEWEAKKAAAKADAAVAMPLAAGWTLYTAKALTAAGGWAKQWRNPANGRWINMPGPALDGMIADLDEVGFLWPEADGPQARASKEEVARLAGLASEHGADRGEPMEDLLPEIKGVLGDLSTMEDANSREAIDKARAAVDAYELSYVAEEQGDFTKAEEGDFDNVPDAPEGWKPGPVGDDGEPSFVPVDGHGLIVRNEGLWYLADPVTQDIPPMGKGYETPQEAGSDVVVGNGVDWSEMTDEELVDYIKTTDAPAIAANREAESRGIDLDAARDGDLVKGDPTGAVGPNRLDEDGTDGDLTEAELQAFIETQPMPEGWTAVVEPGEGEDYPASISLLKDGQPVSSERASTILVTPDGEIEWAGSRGFTEGSLEGYIETYLTDRDPNDSGDIDVATGEPILNEGPMGDTPEAYDLPDKAALLEQIPGAIREAGQNAGGKRGTQANRVAKAYEAQLGGLNGDPENDQAILADIALDMDSRGYVGNEVDEELWKQTAAQGGLTSKEAVRAALEEKYSALATSSQQSTMDYFESMVERTSDRLGVGDAEPRTPLADSDMVDDPFPDDQIPEGWTKQVEPANEWGDPEQTYLSGPEELGEAGMIAVSDENGPYEPGTYWLPGQAEDQQGPFTSLDEAIRAAELGNPWGDLPITERPEVDLGDNPDGKAAMPEEYPDRLTRLDPEDLPDSDLDDALRSVGFDDEALRNMDREDKIAEINGEPAGGPPEGLDGAPELSDDVLNELIRLEGLEETDIEMVDEIRDSLANGDVQSASNTARAAGFDDLADALDRDFELGGYSADTEDAPVAKDTRLRVPRAGGRSLRAAAPPFDPDAPPAAFFDDPHFKTVAPLTITKEGRVMGHLATWGSCHLTHTARGKCVTPPRSRSGYRYFNTGHVLTKEGIEVGVGQLTVGTGHADEGLNAKATLAHYDNTGTAVADVTVGEDAFGIWFSGALRPGVSAAKVRTLRASPLSGDWRQIGQYPLELVAALAVNVQGFPVPRPSGHVRRGEMVSLVAAGMVPPSKVRRPGTPGALSVDDLRYLKRLAARERDAEHEAQQATLSKAAALSRQIAAREMASRVASSVSAMAGDTQNEGGH